MACPNGCSRRARCGPPTWPSSGASAPRSAWIAPSRSPAAAGLPLKIAAKVDRADHDYFEERIRPLLDQPHVEMVGEIAEADKAEFLSGAHALLFPIDWPEPFGLVMIEAMACGTPVIAFEGGSVREVLEDGATGFIVHDVAGAAGAVARLPELSRAAVRRRFEERFTARRMARDYLGVYVALAGTLHSRCVPAGLVLVSAPRELS